MISPAMISRTHKTTSSNFKSGISSICYSNNRETTYGIFFSFTTYRIFSKKRSHSLITWNGDFNSGGALVNKNWIIVLNGMISPTAGLLAICSLVWNNIGLRGEKSMNYVIHLKGSYLMSSAKTIASNLLVACIVCVVPLLVSHSVDPGPCCVKGRGYIWLHNCGRKCTVLLVPFRIKQHAFIDKKVKGCIYKHWNRG